jgi:hypothetical protein
MIQVQRFGGWAAVRAARATAPVFAVQLALALAISMPANCQDRL